MELLPYIHPEDPFYGLKNNDFQDKLLNNYIELVAELGKFIEDIRNSDNDNSVLFINFWINQSRAIMADRKRIILKLAKCEDAESTNKRNNLTALNEKTECLNDFLQCYIDNPAYKKIDYSLIIFKHHETFKSICKKCEVNLNGQKFNKQQYAALYFIIYENHKDIFKSKDFTKIHIMLDKHFGTDTHNYKPNSIINECKSLKDNYAWINSI